MGWPSFFAADLEIIRKRHVPDGRRRPTGRSVIGRTTSHTAPDTGRAGLRWSGRPAVVLLSFANVTYRSLVGRADSRSEWVACALWVMNHARDRHLSGREHPLGFCGEASADDNHVQRQQRCGVRPQPTRPRPPALTRGGVGTLSGSGQLAHMRLASESGSMPGGEVVPGVVELEWRSSLSNLP